MKKETPAEKHEEWVLFGVRRYRETFLRLFISECRGGRVPGTTEMSEEELLAFFREQPPEYFQLRAQQSPADAMRELNEFARLEARSEVQ
jgi:hypothetical protein